MHHEPTNLGVSILNVCGAMGPGGVCVFVCPPIVSEMVGPTLLKLGCMGRCNLVRGRASLCLL